MKTEKSRHHNPTPWERQPGESHKAFEAFTLYRDAQPGISVDKVGEKCRKSASLLYRWCAKYDWKARREAWIDEQDKITLLEMKRGIISMRKKHVDMAVALLMKSALALKNIPAEAMTMSDVAKSLEVAVKIERLSRGEATEKTESLIEHAGEIKVSGGLDLDKLTDDELAALNELLTKSSST